MLASDGLARPVLLQLPGMGIVPHGVELLRTDGAAHVERFAELVHERRKHRGMTLEKARERVTEPLVFAGCLVATGECDGAVAGSEAATADVLRAGLWTIGTAPNLKTVSS